MFRPLLYGPRARRLYYMLGTIAALLAAAGFVMWAFVAASAGRFLETLVAAALIACSVGFVALAYRRTNALIRQAEEEEHRSDPRSARARELDDRAFAMMEQLSREARATLEDPRAASDPQRQAAFKRDLDARLAEIQRLNEESTALSEARIQDIGRRMSGARAALRHVVAVFVVVALAVVVLAWGRTLGYWL